MADQPPGRLPFLPNRNHASHRFQSKLNRPQPANPPRTAPGHLPRHFGQHRPERTQKQHGGGARTDQPIQQTHGTRLYEAIAISRIHRFQQHPKRATAGTGHEQFPRERQRRRLLCANPYSYDQRQTSDPFRGTKIAHIRQKLVRDREPTQRGQSAIRPIQTPENHRFQP